jgi:hypothetical protein
VSSPPSFSFHFVFLLSSHSFLLFFFLVVCTTSKQHPTHTARSSNLGCHTPPLSLPFKVVFFFARCTYTHTHDHTHTHTHTCLCLRKEKKLYHAHHSFPFTLLPQCW